MKDFEWLHAHPVLSINDAERHFASRAYAKLFLHRQMSNGRLKRVGDGQYSASDDAFSIASNLIPPSYLSFLTASHLYNITQIIPIRLQVACRKKRKKTEFEGYSIDFIPVSMMWGYHKEKRGEDEIFLADFEKLLIDAFDRPKEMGNFEEIEMLFEEERELDVEKLKQYIIRAGSGKIYRQIGYLLEKHRGIDISKTMEIDRNYFQLNPFQKGKKKDKKWRLII